MSRRFVDLRTIQQRMQFKDDRINRALATHAARETGATMSIEIPTYLRSHLDVADSLPERLLDPSTEDITMLQRRLRELVVFVANRDEQIVKLTRELDRLRPAIQKGTR